MTSIYDVLKASKGIHVDDTFAELWGRKLSNAYTVATYTGTLPATLQTVEGYLESYKIYGSTVQDGTPTPENPIMPEGVGERTENLFDVKANNPDNGYAYGKQVTLDGSVDTFPQANVSEYISITPFSLYTFTYGSQYNDVYAALYNAKREFVRSIRYNARREITFYSQEDENYLRFTYLRSKEDTVMLNTGSTALPYEPFGYKIPISSANTTTPVYLGEVEATRRIKKLVLTGNESWKTHQSTYYITVSDYYRMYDIGSHLSVCSHYPNIQVVNLPEMHYCLGGLVDGSTRTVWNGNIVFNPSPMISSLIDWRAYLAAQYATGTPVTVWYVLAEPETGIVNEPLMKIGEYADTVSMEQAGVSIPTASGSTVIDYDGTPKPDKVELTYRKPKGQ